MTIAELSGLKTKGDLVERYGVFGIVTMAGPLIYDVEWQRGSKDRYRQGSPVVVLVKPERLAAARVALRIP